MSDSSQRSCRDVWWDSEGCNALQGGDTLRGACRCHSFAAAHMSMIELTFTRSAVAWVMGDGEWFTNNWRSCFRLYLMIGV
jgi:hypothetical protein